MIQRLGKNLIRNFLTVRYNPDDKPPIKPVSWKDFKTTISDPAGFKSEKLLKTAISNLIKEKREPLAISLSSGIDSTLCLGLLRKMLPDEKIIAY